MENEFPWVEGKYNCEDGCEYGGCCETGTSIYGPNIDYFCTHPLNESGSCRACPRAKMNTQELVADLLESMERYTSAMYDLISIVNQAASFKEGRDAGRPYMGDRYKTLGELIDALSLRIRLFERGEDICMGCGTVFPKGDEHVCKPRGE